MRAIKNTGTILVMMALLLMLACLTTNHYRLNRATLDAAVSDSAQLSLLQPALKPMTGEAFSSKFAFTRRYHLLVDKLKKKLEKKGEDTITDDYSKSLLSASVEGFQAQHNTALLLIILFLFTAGSLLVTAGLYGEKQPGISNDGVMKKPITARGWSAAVIAISLMVFYSVLYWFPWLMADWIKLTDPLSNLLNGGNADEFFLLWNGLFSCHFINRY